MKKDTNTKCVICQETYTGFGHNARPIAKGQCCDDCQHKLVLPLRVDLMLSESPAYQMFSRLVQDLGGSHD
tara:strand:+ start:797 stop:1009 length:213 start_codon:yes stop_codon:yes gene_type:complete